MTNKYLQVLENRIIEISNLSISDQSKESLVKNLFERYTSELESTLSLALDEDKIKKAFNHYINNILSILETSVSIDSFKSTRRLILNEIHGCKDGFIKNLSLSNK